MPRQSKKVSYFVILTYIITILFFIVLQINGGNRNPFSKGLIGLSMTFPIISVIIVQKLIFREELKGSLGIPFKLNVWFLYSILIPIIMALIINLISIKRFEGTLFSYREFYINIIIGLTIAAVSALIEELAWRGFLFNELQTLGILKSSILTGIIWALWHTPISIWYKYPESPLSGAVINFVQMFFISLIITYIRSKSESVFACAIMHGLFNTMILSSIMDDFKIVLIKILLCILVLAILIICDSYKKNFILHHRKI
ncbi:MAG: CPBP family intramembrane glutamic endopeptidase [Clostridiaceae bacterium]